MSRKPTRTNLSVLAQLCNLIPAFLVSKIARQSGVDKKARTFSPWSHLVALLFAQFTHIFRIVALLGETQRLLDAPACQVGLAITHPTRDAAEHQRLALLNPVEGLQRKAPGGFAHWEIPQKRAHLLSQSQRGLHNMHGDGPFVEG